MLIVNTDAVQLTAANLTRLIAHEGNLSENEVCKIVAFLSEGNDEPIVASDPVDKAEGYLEALSKNLRSFVHLVDALSDPYLASIAASVEYATLDDVLALQGVLEKLDEVRYSCGLCREKVGDPSTELMLAKVRTAAHFVRDKIGLILSERLDDHSLQPGQPFWFVRSLLDAAGCGYASPQIAAYWTADHLGHNLLKPFVTGDEAIERNFDPSGPVGF